MKKTTITNGVVFLIGYTFIGAIFCEQLCGGIRKIRIPLPLGEVDSPEVERELD